MTRLIAACCTPCCCLSAQHPPWPGARGEAAGDGGRSDWSGPAGRDVDGHPFGRSDQEVIGPVKSDEKGVATLEGLTPATYLVQVEFPGFEPRILKDVRLRAGDNKQGAILAIQSMQDEITVGRDKQDHGRGSEVDFGTTMTREQIEALSDDPDEMRRQIMEMAPDAVLRIDSFEGGHLPPKAQIKSIHIARDQFAAESHYAGAHFIDIITQPGMGPISGGTNFAFRRP